MRWVVIWLVGVGVLLDGCGVCLFCKKLVWGLVGGVWDVGRIWLALVLATKKGCLVRGFSVS